MTTRTAGDCLQESLDQLAASGGGTLSLEPREYVCGTLRLHSGIRLHLPEGCILQASDDPDAFPIVGETYNETGEIRAFLYAEDAENVSVVGKGTVRGNGQQPLSASASEGLGFRPETLFFKNCRHVRIEDLTFRDASFWTIHLLRCEEVDIRGLVIRNRLGRINTDGIDPDGCRNVRISGCDIESGDDCIVIKSTEGDDVRDIRVSDCRLCTPCAAIKMGTETFGDMGHIHFSDCRIEQSTMGFGIFLKDGGTLHDIVAERLTIDSPGEFPVFIDHTPRFEGTSKEGLLRGITLRGLDISSPGRLFVQGGYQSFLEGLTLESIHWKLRQPMELARMGKPSGSLRGSKPPRPLSPEHEPYQICLANIRAFHGEDIEIDSGSPHLPAGRGLLYAEAVHGSLSAFSHPAPHPSCPMPIKMLRDSSLKGSLM